MLSARKNLLMIAVFGSLLMACKKDETSSPTPTPPNEEELITTLILTFTDQETPTEIFELRFTDLDGDGGNAPVITGDTLPANRAYNLSLRVLNESGSTPEEITNEIEEEGTAHQFFFQPVATTLLVTYADADANGQPIGLANLATTAAPGEGTITVTLRHEPNKTAAGVINGDITNAGGETDIEVTFPVIVD
ncbi:MAG: type 1 periplasmic binding fold superfamily protein [Flavobacteriales bacterium]|nr:type 1 periplasmic binding fold superfamily protein [Flavobacteriales bacterium]